MLNRSPGQSMESNSLLHMGMWLWKKHCSPHPMHMQAELEAACAELVATHSLLDERQAQLEAAQAGELEARQAHHAQQALFEEAQAQAVEAQAQFEVGAAQPWPGLAKQLHMQALHFLSLCSAQLPKIRTLPILVMR